MPDALILADDPRQRERARRELEEFHAAQDRQRMEVVSRIEARQRAERSRLAEERINGEDLDRQRRGVTREELAALRAEILANTERIIEETIGRTVEILLPDDVTSVPRLQSVRVKRYGRLRVLQSPPFPPHVLKLMEPLAEALQVDVVVGMKNLRSERAAALTRWGGNPPLPQPVIYFDHGHISNDLGDTLREGATTRVVPFWCSSVLHELLHAKYPDWSHERINAAVTSWVIRGALPN